MLFQKEMRLPTDNEMLPRVHDQKEQDPESSIQLLLEQRKLVFQETENSIKAAQIRQKHTYDRKHIQEELTVGTEVLVENTAQKQRKGRKLQELFKGKYTIAESCGKGLYKIMNEQRKVHQKTLTISRLKVYKNRDCTRSITNSCQVHK